MIKNFFKDSAVYTIGTALTRGIAIIMVPIYTRLLSTSDYGTIDLFTVIASFINVTIALEINQGFGRHYAESASESDRIEYSSTAFWFIIAVYTVFFALVFLFAAPLNHMIIGQEASASLFRIAMFSTFAGSIFIFLQNQLRWYLKSRHFATTGIVFTFVSYSITVILMTIFGMKAEGVFMGLLAGYIVAGLLSYYYSHTNYRFSFNYKKLKQMLAFSVPLVPASVGTVILLYIDRFAIKNLMTLSDVGIFGVSYRFAAIISLVLSGFQTALAPLIYQNYRDANTPPELARIFRYFLALVLSAIFGLSIFAREVLIIFTTPSYYGASAVIPMISIAALFLSMNIFAPGLQIAKKTSIIAVINIAAAVINTALNFMLIPHLGIIGAGLATLISAVLSFSSYMYFSQKFFRVPHTWGKIFQVFIFVIIFTIVAFMFDNYSRISPGIIALKAAILTAAIVFLFQRLVGFGNIKNIYTVIIKSKTRS